MSALPSPGLGAPRLSRRTFLAAGSALALASTVAGRALLQPVAGDGSLASLARSTGRWISVGFVDLTSARGPLDLSGRPEVVPASIVRSATSLGDSAMARVAGLTPGVLDAPPVAGIHLDALFPNPGGTEPLRHHAWTMRTEPLSASPPLRFVAPIGDQSLGFAMQTFPRDGNALEATSVMTAGEEQHLPGFRPGTYLLGIGEGIWDAPGRLPGLDDHAWAELASLAITIAPR